MSLTVLSYPGSTNTAKGLIAAQYGGVTVNQDPEFQMGVTNKSKAFKALNPNQKVPTLVIEQEDGSKQAVFESNAIARYVCSVGNEAGQALLGGDAYSQAMVSAWCDWAQTELSLPATAWLGPINGWMPYSAAGETQAKSDVKKLCMVLNTHLKDKTFLVGERVTLADIVVACTLVNLYKGVLAPKFRKPFANTTRWFQTVVNQPEALAVLGEVALAETMAEVDPAVIAEAEAAAASTSDNNNNGGGKKKGKKKAANNDAGTSDAAAAAPAADKVDQKAYFKAMAPTSMNLDDFKKLYSNNDTRDILGQFWEMYDPSGYCFYEIEYKYASDFTQAFMASNLVGGWFQRLPRLHKHAFASVLILKNADDSLAIKGIWMFRGDDLPPDMQDSDDAEHYTWRKMNTEDEAERTLIGNYMAWDGFDGVSVEDGKNFK